LAYAYSTAKVDVMLSIAIRLMNCAALLLAIALASVPSISGAAPAVIDEAEVAITVAGTTRQTEPIHLSFNWDRSIGAVDGQARFVMQIPVSNISEPLAIYIPRVGNSFVVNINQHELARYGSNPPGPYDDAATRPRYFSVPADWLTPQTTLEVIIAAKGGRFGGLSTITTGSPEEVHKLFARDEFEQINLRLMLIVVGVMLGMLGLLWWVRQRDISYLYYALAELLWSFLTARHLLSPAPLPWPLWGHVIQAAFVLSVPLQCKFALIVIDQDKGWVSKLTNFLIIGAIPAVAAVGIYGGRPLGFLWMGLLAIDVLAMAWVVFSTLSRDSNLERKILAGAVAIMLICAIRDVTVRWMSPSIYTDIAWVRYAWTGFGIGFAWIIAERMRRATNALSAMNASLADQLAARDVELTAAFERERVRDMEQGALLERQRLMRDLHDGLGSHLVGALRMAQQVSASKAEITAQLRMAVDQLKITVDAMQDVEGDIPSLLGAIRYRLSPRLQAAGISLKWNVDPLPTMQHWGVRQSYDLQMILLEVFTNIVTHSGANCVTLSAHPHVQQPISNITIEICDNGTGIPPDSSNSSAGKGMASMLARAKALGAVMSIRSGTDGTCVVLALTCADDA
jgi:signal transduction histidine kinase